MSTSEADSEDGQVSSSDPEVPAPPDEKELVLQRRLARIEEALGLSPIT